MKEGKIPHLKFGRRYVIPRAALTRLLESAGAPETTETR
jgi:excisionase family DNA binding protein